MRNSYAFAGFGQGLTMMQIITHVLKSAPKEIISRVTPITTFAQQIMASFGVTIAMAYLSGQIRELPTQHTLGQLGHSFGSTFCVTLGFAIVALVLSLFFENAPKLRLPYLSSLKRININCVRKCVDFILSLTAITLRRCLQ
jgi:hypothetical protein